MELKAGNSHSPRGSGHLETSFELETGSVSAQGIQDGELDSPET